MSSQPLFPGDRGITVQIDEIFYACYDFTVTDARGVGRTSASAKLELVGNSFTPPQFPRLVSIVTKDKNGIVEKHFGGRYPKRDCTYEPGTRTFELKFEDFSYLIKKFYIRNYSRTDNVVGHLRNLFATAGVIVSPASPEITKPLLSLEILGEPTLPIIDDPTSDLFPYEFSGYFVDALIKLCEEWDYYFEVNFGTWIDISKIADNEPLANLFVVRNNHDIQDAPFNIKIDESGNQFPCEDDTDMKFSGLKLSESPPEFSAAYVLGLNSAVTLSLEELEGIGFSRLEAVKKDISVNSVVKHYPLNAETNVLLYVDAEASPAPTGVTDTNQGNEGGAL